MTGGPTSSVFAHWNSPTQRAQRAQVVTPFAPAKRQPFSKPSTAPQPGPGGALKTARIYLFTGSNTPYQSHE